MAHCMPITRQDDAIPADLRGRISVDTKTANKAVLNRFWGNFRGRTKKQDKDLTSLTLPGLPHLPAVRASFGGAEAGVFDG